MTAEDGGRVVADVLGAAAVKQTIQHGMIS